MEVVYVPIPQIKILLRFYLLFIFLCIFASYFIKSFFTYKVSKSERVSFPFLSWIPVLRPYNYFEMTKGSRFGLLGIVSVDKRIMSALYIVGGVMVALISQISPILFSIFGSVYLVLRASLYFKLYRSLKLDNSELLTTISTIIPALGIMTAYISYYADKKREKEMEDEWEDVHRTTPDYRVPKAAVSEVFDPADTIKDDGDDLHEVAEEDKFGFVDDRYFGYFLGAVPEADDEADTGSKETIGNNESSKGHMSTIDMEEDGGLPADVFGEEASDNWDMELTVDEDEQKGGLAEDYEDSDGLEEFAEEEPDPYADQNPDDYFA